MKMPPETIVAPGDKIAIELPVNCTACCFRAGPFSPPPLGLDRPSSRLATSSAAGRRRRPSPRDRQRYVEAITSGSPEACLSLASNDGSDPTIL
jgi:hypothetical protein